MKSKTWLKPLIIVAIVIVAFIAIMQGLNSYLASRSVVLTMEDIVTTVKALSSYLIALAAIIIVAIIVVVASIKLKKPLGSMVRWQALVASILAIVIIVNMICVGPQYSLINNMLGDQYYLSESTISASEALVEEIASEGMVLLKNVDNVLPLDQDEKINVFGWSSTNPIYGGTGSGAVDESTCTTLLQGLEGAGFKLNENISDFYTNYRDSRPAVGMTGQDWTIPEPTMEEYDEAGIFDNAKSFSNKAIIVIARTGGENTDLPTSITDEDTYDPNGGWAGPSGVRYTSNPDDVNPDKTYLELSNREQSLIERVTQEFQEVFVVVNSANAMELGFLDEYDAIKGAIWCAGPGETGFAALGQIISGGVNPSARLVDTFVYDLMNIPAINYVGDFRYDNMHEVVNSSADGYLYASFNNYVEGIYVGYKFYETAEAVGMIDYNQVVQYPFGYGLSYTEFEQRIVNTSDDGDTITLEVEVKNVGDVAGKDVVEVYFTPPYENGGIEKAEVNLIQYQKTAELAPGEVEKITVAFAKEDMASYDSAGIKANGGGYVLEKGDYEISIRTDSHTVIMSESVSVASDVIYNEENDGSRDSDEIIATNQFDFAEGDVTYLSRADQFANYTEAMAAPDNFTMSQEHIDTFYAQTTYDISKVDDSSAVMPTTGANNGLSIQDMTGVAYDDEKWETLLDQLSVEEMNTLIATGGYASAKVSSIGLPALIECDGPAAIKNNYTGQSGTAFPAATMIAATWSKELAMKRGEMMGQQCQDMNVVGWYGPAMNIHRTPFSGRNFEYYSEDGLLSGYMGAYEVLGTKSVGVQTYMKHFALNDSEINRKNMLCTWVNEQALREIYLKPFEISTKLGESQAAMTAFNYIGNVWAGCCPELLQTVLRDEWGFVGVTVTDWFNGLTDGNMLADSAIRTGGDKMLSSQGDPIAFASNTNQPATVIAMRQSTHNILYSIANSNAMDERNFTTPGWVKTFITVDVIICILILALEAFIVIRFMKKRKEEVTCEVETQKEG